MRKRVQFLSLESASCARKNDRQRGIMSGLWILRTGMPVEGNHGSPIHIRADHGAGRGAGLECNTDPRITRSDQCDRLSVSGRFDGEISHPSQSSQMHGGFPTQCVVVRFRWSNPTHLQQEGAR